MFDVVNKSISSDLNAFIVLDSDLCEEVDCSVGIKALTDEELENANIVAIGRGGDKNCYSLWKSPGQIGKVKKYYIYHNADIVEGNSGGPIFKDDDPKNIIALQKFELTYYSSIRHYPNVGLRIRQEMIDDFNKVKNGELKAHSLPDTE